MTLNPLKITFLIFISLFVITINGQSFSAHDYANRVHANIIDVLHTKDGLFTEDPEAFLEEISKAFAPIVDFERISRNVMGKHFNKATKEQQIEFSKAFRTSLLNTYSKTLIEFKDEKIVVLPPNEGSNSLNKTRVEIKIITSSKSYPGVYSMYLDKNKEWKIVNIVINGINLGLTFRSQFYSLMEKNQNNIDAVINEWVTSL
ncbi:MAG: toluene tolerance protein [Gammaproteobacteria bacterium]|nr:toluene tolerance protein [Gammaproteobacteria bacterium]HJL96340.1 ABC transporter substrate-binding protein [SAR86 cluster bacterium]|tara:strand:+ start:14326 stop:14934 length:609 start_codon:yes stop_codon:yes gene_type:complete